MAGNAPRIAVMGGSLGGLTAALLLRERGCEVHVYERSRAPLQDRGAGIVLHPATIRYLRDVAGHEQSSIGVPARTLRYLDRDGAVVAERPCRYRFSSYYALHRDLLACFGGERYHLATEVTGFELSDAAAEVELAGRDAERFHALLCADGVGSTARRRLLPGVEPRYAGYVGWRGAVPVSEDEPATFDLLYGAITYQVMPNSHMLVYPIPAVTGNDAGRRVLNWVWYRNVAAGEELADLLTDTEGAQRPTSVPPGRVREPHLAGLRAEAEQRLAPQLAAMVGATPQPFVQTVYDIEVERMAFGRAALIGDAAFALRPHIAAGTAKAADDGWHLAEAMDATGNDVVAALERWEPGRLELGRHALARTREAGARSQFTNTWRVGDRLPFGLYEEGDNALD